MATRSRVPRRVSPGRKLRGGPVPGTAPGRAGPAEGGMSDRNVSTDSGMRAWAWRWGPDEDRRPGLPWIGIFLVIFGLLLLLEQLLPDYRKLGDVAILAAGLAALLAWLGPGRPDPPFPPRCPRPPP